MVLLEKWRMTSPFLDVPVTLVNYDRIESTVSNLLEEYASDGCHLTFLDFRLEPKYIEALLNGISGTLHLVDHHEWSSEDLDRLDQLKTKFGNRLFYVIDQRKCGAEIVFDLTNSRSETSNLRELVEITGIFDCWKTENPKFKTHALPLNEIYWSLGKEKFVQKFGNGFDLGFYDEECQQIADDFEKNRESSMQQMMDEMSFEVPIGDEKLLCVVSPTMKYASLFTVYYPDYQYYLIYKGEDRKSKKKSLSFRSKSTVTSNELAAAASKFDPDVTGGGHPAAGGLVFPARYELQEAFETAIAALTTARSIKNS